MKKLSRQAIGIITGFLVLFGILGGVIIHHAVKKHKDEKKAQEVYYTFSEVEKPVSYLASDEEMQTKLSRLIDPLYKSDYIDRIYIEQMIHTLGLDPSVYEDLLKGYKEEDWVPAEIFDRLYLRIIDSGAISGIEKRSLFFYGITYSDASNENTENENAENGNLSAATDGDAKKEMLAIAVYDGAAEYPVDSVKIPEECQNRIMTVYLKDGVIFKLGDESSETVTFYNAWIDSCGNGSCTFMPDRELVTFPLLAGVEEKEHCVADVTLDNTGVTKLDYMEDTMEGRIISVTEEGLRMEGKGAYSFDEHYKVFNVSGDEPYREETSNMLLGYKKVKMIASGNTVKTVLIEDEITSERIRVILNDSSYSSYKHIALEISGEGAFSVTVNEEEPVVYASGEIFRILPKDYEIKSVIKIESVEPSDKLMINNLARSSGVPAYRGVLEVTVMNDCLHVVNDLPLEEYLYAVVSSEVPASYSEEAQKAMAICARGYAYSKMKDGSYASYGAHLDDSTMCQVYNNVPETETSIFAVKDTYGMVMTYQNRLITPFYFSTSAGVTSPNTDIWGGNRYEYLTAGVETLDKKDINLSEEADFKKFISDSYGYDTIEKDLPFYRWQIPFTAREFSVAINTMLSDRIKNSDGGIKVQGPNGNFRNQEIPSIGDVESVEITKRSESGVVLEMLIYGSEYVIQVSGQTNIRNLITPKDVVIIRQDGSVIKDWTSLPSPYYYIEKNPDGYTIIGGGFGHGVGMSQNGAELLAEQGYNYKYILSHYFRYVDFDYIYGDKMLETEPEEEASEEESADEKEDSDKEEE